MVLAAAASDPAAAVEPHPSPEETKAEFQEICERMTAGENSYFGTSRVGWYREQLERERAGALRLEPKMSAELRARLANELLKLGDSEGAADLLIETIDIAEKSGLGDRISTSMLDGLGLAHLRMAEVTNCVAMHAAGSCILPIRESAIHPVPEPSRKAAKQFLRYLERRPDDLQARWLLNLSRMISGDYPDGVPESLRVPSDAFESEEDVPLWPDRAPELGINVIDLAGGAVMEDFDGDGLLDLVTSTWDPCGSVKAFRNDGLGGFENVTTAWGLDGQLGSLNLVHADYDNDGDRDLLVLRGAWLGQEGRIRNSLLRNDLDDERGRFVDVTVAAGLAYPAYPTQAAAWADYDGDGDLDLYIGNESYSVEVYSWSLVQDPGRAFPSQLFRNNGDGTFTDVARAAGVRNMRYTKGAAWGDYDNDGDPDLYLSNLGLNRLYRNDGLSGNVPRFTDVAAELGVTRPEKASFGTWFFDYDNDGDLDLYVNDYSVPVADVSASYMDALEGDPGGYPLIYRNELDADGVRTFREVSDELGLDRPLLPMGANYGDLDNDGWADIVLGTGVPDLEALMPDVVYRNAGAERFLDVTFAIGMGHLQKGHGAAFGDLDNDGDQDLLRQMGGAYPTDAFSNALYENPTKGKSWVTLRLRGQKANRDGIGGRIELLVREGDETRTIHQLVGTGGSFGSSSLQQEIGLGDASVIERLTIRWPGSGTVQQFESVPVNRVWLVVEGKDDLEQVRLPRIELGGDGSMIAGK